MKDFFKKWAGALIRLWTYEPLPDNEVEAYKVRARNRRRSLLRRGLILAAVALVIVLIVLNVSAHAHYDSYEIKEDSASVKTDNVSTYLTVDQYILRYSSDGVSLLNNDLSGRWNVTYTMEDPRADVCGDTILIYDKDSTSVMIFDKDGKLGEFTSEKPIVKGRVSSAGNVALLLEDDGHALIRYLTSEGETIAVASTTLEALGYPADLDISDNGLYLAVSYMYVGAGTTGSRLVLYDFSVKGSRYTDNILWQDTYDGILIPEVFFAENKTLIANREDGFTVYNAGNGKRTEEKTFEGRVLGTFRTDNRTGYVFEADEEDEGRYRIEFYDKGGSLRNTVSTDLLYDRIEVSRDQVLLTNSSSLAVIADNGCVRFTGSFDEGLISSALHLTGTDYLLVTNSKTEIIVLK